MAAPPPPQTILNIPWKILIIDDDEEDVLIVRSMLKEAKGRKFHIDWVNTYAAGKEKLFSDHYHAVLVDYDLGARSGIELIREANELGVAAPLILFTGRGNYEVDVEAMAAGATLYLVKGEVNPLLLERAIRYAIETKQRENELREARETAERELAERRRAEEELQKREATLRESEAILRRLDARWNAAIESVDVGVIIATEDEQVIYWNPAAQKMHGFTRPNEGIEPLEKTPVTFQLWTPDSSHMLDLDEWPMRRIKRGEPVRDLELCIRRPDQGWEKFFSYSGVMVDTTSGERLIFLTCQDLTEKRQVEDALRESQSRLIEFVENIHANYFSLDREWRITYVNRHFSELLGMDRSDMLGKNFWEVFSQYLGTDVEPRYRKVMAERVPIHFRRGGIYSKSLYDISLYPTEEGLASFSIDRTDEMRYQQQLENERARWQGVVEGIADEVWLSDTEGKMSLINLPDQTAMGLEEFQDRPYEKVFEELEVLAPDGQPLPDDQAPLLRALKGEIVRGEEILRHRKTGKTRYRQYSAAPTRDENGRITGSVAIAHDITQLKQTEAALRISEEKFASAFRSSPVAIAISTVKDGRFIEVNDSYTDLFGFSREELIGHTSIELGMFPDPEERKEVVRRFKENNGFRNYELRLLTKTGQPRDVLFSTERIDLEGQECMLSLVVDITERKEAEKALAETAEKLVRSNRELEQFAFVASHDLKEPLRKVIMFSELLRHHLGDTPAETAGDYLTRMEDAAARMQAMIDGLLDLSRVNRQGGEFTRLNLNQVVGEVVEDLEERLQAAGGQVRIASLPQIHGDEVQIRQLFQNIIGNALKFHRPGVPPVVRISGTIGTAAGGPAAGGPVAEIRVEDNGIGFEQEYVDQIFQPFKRLHGKSEYEGSGLGLAICQKIVERHHGTIVAESIPGKGSTFIIHLPIQ